MNNPGLGCGDIETSRQGCMSKPTCEQLEDYFTSEAPPRCQGQDEALSMCAFE